MRGSTPSQIAQVVAVGRLMNVQAGHATAQLASGSGSVCDFTPNPAPDSDLNARVAVRLLRASDSGRFDAGPRFFNGEPRMPLAPPLAVAAPAVAPPAPREPKCSRWVPAEGGEEGDRLAALALE
jgi:hypothetical protein